MKKMLKDKRLFLLNYAIIMKKRRRECTMKKKMKIQAFKHPNIPHYEWEGEMLEKTDDYVIVLCKPGRELVHHTKGRVFTLENTTIELFPLNEWYTISCQIREGEIKSYYCNIAKPSEITEDAITFVDLDLDLINKFGEWEVVDEDEFIENSEKYRYSNDLIEKTKKELRKLKEKAEKNALPFHQKIEEYMKKAV